MGDIVPSNVSKSRCFFILLYPDDSNFEKYKEVIEKNANIRAFALHDKDINDEGKLKKPHFHYVVYFENALSIDGCFRKFENIIPFNYIEMCSHIKRGVRYLVHKDHPEKFQYPNEIITSTFDISRYLRDGSEENKEIGELIERIASGEINSIYSYLRSGINYGTLRRNWGMMSALMREIGFRCDAFETTRDWLYGEFSTASPWSRLEIDEFLDNYNK